MDPEKTIDDIRNERFEKLPPDRRPARDCNYCTAAHVDGYLCTRERGHTGQHVAHGHLYDVITTWD